LREFSIETIIARLSISLDRGDEHSWFVLPVVVVVVVVVGLLVVPPPPFNVIGVGGALTGSTVVVGMVVMDVLPLERQQALVVNEWWKDLEGRE